MCGRALMSGASSAAGEREAERRVLKAEAERGAGLGHSADAGRAGEWRSGRAKQAVGKLGRALASGGKAPSRPCAGERGGAWDWADSWCWADAGRRKKQAG